MFLCMDEVKRTIELELERVHTSTSSRVDKRERASNGGGSGSEKSIYDTLCHSTLNASQNTAFILNRRITKRATEKDVDKVIHLGKHGLASVLCGGLLFGFTVRVRTT